MIYNEVFDYCYNILRGTSSRVRDAYEQKRYNRALLALRSQNYFLSCSFQNESGAAAITGVDNTEPIERPLIVRGGGMNTRFLGGDGNAAHSDISPGGVVNVKLFRSGPGRAQISKDFIRNSHYFSYGDAQKWGLDWLVPWTLDPNEIIQARFEQMSATNANQIYNIGFYGVAVDRSMRCDENLLEDMQRQIVNTIPKPRYIHLKTDIGGGTIVFADSPAALTPQRAAANTIEAPEHLLILGWRRLQVDVKINTAAVTVNSTMKLVVSGGPAFSRLEIPVNAFELFTRPDDGYFRLAVPHFLPKGSSLALSVTSVIRQLLDQFEGEIELLCVTV